MDGVSWFCLQCLQGELCLSLLMDEASVWEWPIISTLLIDKRHTALFLSCFHLTRSATLPETILAAWLRKSHVEPG